MVVGLLTTFRRGSFWAACGLAAAFYLLLIDTVDLPELYAGVAAVLISGVGFAAAGRGGMGGVATPLEWVARGWRAIAQIPADVLSVSVTALAQLVSPRASRGVLRVARFHYGQPDQPRDVGRRALAEALGSLTPNTIVIGIDHERNVIVAHQLRRTGGAEAVDVLRLG